MLGVQSERYEETRGPPSTRDELVVKCSGVKITE